MALGDSYADVSDLETRLAASDDGTFATRLAEASRAVEAFTGRQFNKTTTATARLFRPLDWLRLPVDDFHTTTDLAISVDGTAWDVANVDPRPWNGIVHGQLGWPYSDLIADGQRWPWNRRAEVSVTAQWGWDAVPEAIKQATLDVAEFNYSAPAATGVIQSERVGDYSITYQASAARTAPPEMARAMFYVRKRFGVA